MPNEPPDRDAPGSPEENNAESSGHPRGWPFGPRMEQDPRAVQAELDIIAAGCVPSGNYLEKWDEATQQWVKTDIPVYELPPRGNQDGGN